jgi:hypothetical protein
MYPAPSEEVAAIAIDITRWIEMSDSESGLKEASVKQLTSGKR